VEEVQEEPPEGKDGLYAWLAGHGFHRESVVDELGTVSHAWERKCLPCANIAFLTTDPREYGETALSAIYYQARAIVHRCGHDVE
jgi:hypothetical protein